MTPEALNVRSLLILYDVQAYAHASWRLGWRVPEGTPARLANRLLLARLEAADAPTGVGALPCEDAMFCLCVAHWLDLAAITYLLGAHAMRSAIVRSGRSPRLQWGAASFMHFPLPHICPALPGERADSADDDSIYLSGTALLEAALPAPAILLTRARLLMPQTAFHGRPMRPVPPWPGQASHARLLLKSAIAYRQAHVQDASLATR